MIPKGQYIDVVENHLNIIWNIYLIYKVNLIGTISPS